MNATDIAVPTAANHPEAAKAVKVADQAFEVATAYVIDSPEMYQAAGEELRDIATKAKQIEETRLSLTRPIDEAKRRIMDLFRAPLDRLKSAEEVLRGSMLTWKKQEDARIAREREEAERAAAAARQRIEQERIAAEAAEREARDKADAALAAGNDDEALMAIAAAEDAAAAAEAAAEAAEIAEIAPPVALTATAPKAAGIASRQNWKFEVTSLEQLVAACAGVPVDKLARRELLVYLTTDDKAIGGVAKALKAETRIPGVRVYAEDSLAVRRR
jgi:hypothetical protein